MPAVDIFENGQQELVLKAELPDMKREDIAVVFENNTLTLKGERKFDSVERAYSTFSRSFSLPASVDAREDACREKISRPEVPSRVVVKFETAMHKHTAPAVRYWLYA